MFRDGLNGGGRPHLVRYQWKSGSMTITEYEEDVFRINGKAGK